MISHHNIIHNIIIWYYYRLIIDINNKIRLMLIGIRHGERADHSKDSNEVNRIEKKYDPHLT